MSLLTDVRPESSRPAMRVRELFVLPWPSFAEFFRSRMYDPGSSPIEIT